MHKDGYAAGKLIETLADGRRKVRLDEHEQDIVVDADVVHRVREMHF
jgi:hypothetical protein